MRTIPYVTAAQMAEVDRAMIEDYHITLMQMMENAGRNLAHLTRSRFLDGNPVGKNVIVLAGRGGNGGGALVCARRLSTWGARVRVFVSRPPEAFTGVPAHQLDILMQMGVPVGLAEGITQAEPADVVIDGLIGYSLAGAPRGATADLIRWANAQVAPILALDVPSGIDASTGTVYELAIRATATMTLALPKVGLRADGAASHVGELYLADISVPPGLYAGLHLDPPVGYLFNEGEILRLV
jgi:NAD(P)H-hydrate epimerase